MDVLPRHAGSRRHASISDPHAFGLVLVGALLLAGVMAADRYGSARSLASEWPPDLRPWYLVRSAGLAAASFALLIGLRRLTTDVFDRRPRVDASRFELSVALLGAVPAVASALWLLADPAGLSAMVREDGVVEWASAVLAFVAAALYGAAALRRARLVHVRVWSGTTVALILAAGACLLLGLEEISWFQRVLDVESPEFMVNRNGQQELNLHNLATDVTGNAYFVGAFLFCIAIPFLLGDRVLPSGVSWLEPLVPTRLVLVATATSAGVVYEMWNIVWIQMTFWLTLVALANVGNDRTTQRLGRTLLVVTVLVATTHLTFGDEMIRSWDDTEVRELIIPFGLAVAGLDVLCRRP
jgi:hypothetical protein